MPSVSHDPRHSSLGIDYWLHRCEGFRVDSPVGRVGTVKGVRFEGSIEAELLEVRSGLLGHRHRLIPRGRARNPAQATADHRPVSLTQALKKRSEAPFGKFPKRR
jgi:hypothetical protein